MLNKQFIQGEFLTRVVDISQLHLTYILLHFYTGIGSNMVLLVVAGNTLHARRFTKPKDFRKHSQKILFLAMNKERCC
jgi:hypothetical protein